MSVGGRAQSWQRISDEGESPTYSFCPECGATLFYVLESEPDLIAVAVGAFGDPTFAPPQRSVWESRKHTWVTRPADIEHHN